MSSGCTAHLLSRRDDVLKHLRSHCFQPWSFVLSTSSGGLSVVVCAQGATWYQQRGPRESLYFAVYQLRMDRSHSAGPTKEE
jgi:hypothetical protein